MEQTYYTPSQLAGCCGLSSTVEPTLINISAQVINEFNEPVPYAHVWLPDHPQLSATTDESGYFTLIGVPADANVQFTYSSLITLYVAGSITNVVKINTIIEGDEVIVEAPHKDNMFKYFAFGLLGVAVLYSMNQSGSKPNRKTSTSNSDKKPSTKKPSDKKPSTKKPSSTKSNKTVKASV